MECIVISDEDFNFEENIVNNPFKIKPWIHYIESKQRRFKSKNDLFYLYERAVKQLPGSYKLWYQYLVLRMNQVLNKPLSHKGWNDVINVFERCLYTLHKMPVIWLEYGIFLIRQKLITKVRKTYDRALQALPITQHYRIWKDYIYWVKTRSIPIQSAMSIFKRYLKLNPSKILEYIGFLVEKNQFFEACCEYQRILDDKKKYPTLPITEYEIWMKLCNIISNHPTEIKGFNVNIMRNGLKKYPVNSGSIWCGYANYYIHLGALDQAREIFEEALESIITVKDFTTVYSAYSKFEEEVIQVHMEQDEDEELEDEGESDDEDEEDEEEGSDEDEMDVVVEKLEFSEKDELELKMKRWEDLIDRRGILLNNVKLRQNPHNVGEWFKRVLLFKNPEKIIETFTQALDTIDPMKASGRLSNLWVSFAKYYEEEFGDIDKAREIFEISLKKKFRGSNDIQILWCEYAEMELRNKNLTNAKKILQRATSENEKSVKLWEFLVDVEESTGDLENTRRIYEKMIRLKVVTPMIILSYANLLEEQRFFESSFSVYEKGISLFSYPIVYHLWVPYLIKFVSRYKGTKLERTRDLFQQALNNVPKKYGKKLYLLYAKYEEEFGLIKNALQILDKGIEKIENDQKEEYFYIYIKTASDYYSISKIRSIYEKALHVLPKKNLKEMYLKYVNIEIKLGEIDRARALYANCSKYVDEHEKEEQNKFFDDWEEFEKIYGNVDTYKEMQKIKHNVLGFDDEDEEMVEKSEHDILKEKLMIDN